MRLLDVEYSLQIYYVITFVAALHCNIVYVALYDLAYVLIGNCIHRLLVCCPYVFQSVFQSGRHHIVAVHSSGVLKDVCFSSPKYILIWLYLKKATHEGHPLEIARTVNHNVCGGEREHILGQAAFRSRKSIQIRIFLFFLG